MIARYTRPEMGQIWSDESKFQALLEVEIAVAKAQAELGIIPKGAAQDIEKKSKFSVERILEIEKTTKHDVIAFVSNVAENVGLNGRFVHFGMTSSDVLDTALSLQLRRAQKVLVSSLEKLEKALQTKAREHETTLCAGRTHGMHAEPVSFGLKMAGFLAELRRNKIRLQRAFEQVQIAKLSGAVGTYSTQPETVERKVAQKLKLTQETVATQVIPRDRHADLMTSLAILAGGLERLATEIRHLQRTEVGEVREGFSKGQKGSSAMPHKRNPIGSENITGCARLLRSYALASLENIALWHERDISHSSVERVILPDAMIIADYALDRMADTVNALEIDHERMRENMNASQGMLMSSHLLLSLVEKGLSREEAYAYVQKLSHTLKKNEHLKEKLKSDKNCPLSDKEINEVFSGKKHLEGIRQSTKRV